MQDRALPTHAWNLSLPAAVSMLAACGPTVIPAGETDTNAATDTDPGPTEATDTTAGQCNDASDCAPGEDCIGGVCMPYEYYCDEGCCYEDCHYYECYDDSECAPTEICMGSYMGCVAPPVLPACETSPSVAPLELPWTGDAFVSMAFIDANGDTAEDLLISRSESTELHLGGPALAPPVILPLDQDLYTLDMASGDFDGDGDTDLVFVGDAATLVLVTGNGDGTFTTAQELSVGFSPTDLEPLQWDGGGGLELLTLDTEGDVVLRATEAGVFASSVPVITADDEMLSLVGFDQDGNGIGDFVIQGQVIAQIYLGNAAGDVRPDLELPGLMHGPRELLAAHMDGQPASELVGLTGMGDWTLLELWANGGGLPQVYSALGAVPQAGDLDGDGVDDLVVVTSVGLSNGLGFVRGIDDGGQPSFACQGTYPFRDDFTSWTHAVGDFDGNGRVDVAIAVEQVVTVMLTQ